MNTNAQPSQKSYSGIFPHLAVTNEGKESGIGAVVPWAGRLWYLTYPPHEWNGSNDYLYSLDSDYKPYTHLESVGGTHANRLIHRESNQLFIGPYVIDGEGHVRVIDPHIMKGRLTGVARHLHDPENKVIYYTMESGLHEVDVHTLEVNTWHEDPNEKKGLFLLPGTHGKGAYSGQRRLIVSNNGNGGVLAEWNGKGNPGESQQWTIVDVNKYTEVTGPGGIYGNESEDQPVWAIGWDDRSVLLNVCDQGEWKRFRLPKGSFTHTADHGWYTEWPRIREVEDRMLMDMFGMIYEFPPTFSSTNRAGIRPFAVHHKMIVDFASWKDQIVLACNDASLFDNALLGRQQSNLWFGSIDDIRRFGPPSGWGGYG